MTFRTHYKHFEYLMMFFKLINVSTTFQIHVNKTLKNLIDIVCVIYLNDILIFSKNRESHVKNVTIVLRKLKKFRLYVKLKKCFFFRQCRKIFEIYRNARWRNDEFSTNNYYLKLIYFTIFQKYTNNFWIHEFLSTFYL